MEQIKLGDTPEQLGQITAADAMMVDGKIVTRDDYRALIAQVEVLQSWVKQAAELVNVDAGTAIDWLIDNCYDLRSQAKATPQQHLRHIQAEAGRAGFIAGVEARRIALLNDEQAAIKADQYAASVRDGEK